jgi:hypothetical protein
LVQAELERRGIVTASITMLPEITERMRPPRALAVPYPLGYPLGAPADVTLQHRVLRAVLALCSRADVPLIQALG